MAAIGVVNQFHNRLQEQSACCSSGSFPCAFSDSRQTVALPVVARPVYVPLVGPGFHDCTNLSRGSAICCSAVGNNVDASLRCIPAQARQILTLYDILGVSNDASDRDLQLAFRCMAKKYHPDHAPPESVFEYQSKFLEVRRAYEVLKDRRSRALYDFEVKNSPKYWAQRFDCKHRQWRGANWETDQCWTS